MPWIKFSDRKPKNGHYLITRSPGYQGKGDAIESWDSWDGKRYKNIRPTNTHWWDGPDNFDYAIEAWNEEKRKKEEIKNAAGKTSQDWRRIFRRQFNNIRNWAMVVIKGKEKKLNKKLPSSKNMSAKSKKILRRPQDTQPIATVAV
jgi:hypothetical protein